MTMCTTTIAALLLLSLIAVFTPTTHATQTKLLQPSPDLTPAELALLQTISQLPSDNNNNNHNQHDNNNTNDPHGLLQNLQTRIKTIQSEITSLDTHVTKIVATTLDSTKFTDLWPTHQSLRRESEGLMGFGYTNDNEKATVSNRQYRSRTQRRQDESDLEDDETTLPNLMEINDYNTQKMIEVERHLDELKSLVEDEYDRLTSAMQILTENERNSTDITDNEDDDDDDPEEEEITTDEMERSIRWHNLVTNVERNAQESLQNSIETSWNSKILQEKERYVNKAKELERKLKTQLNGIEKVDACMEVLETGGLVYAALRAEGEWMVDHLSVAGSVVYGSRWTSDTFEPSDIRKGKKRHRNVDWTLGDIFGSIIPEDWEQFLPAEWDQYDISFLQDYSTYSNLKKQIRSMIPNYVWHTLPTAIAGPASSTNTASTGVVGSIPPPPEMVLNPNTNLGSCWPLPHRTHGEDDGKITIRLKYPVRVEGITVDHYSGTVSQMDKLSAPRSFVVVGYPPCAAVVDGEEDDGGNECRAMGFDVSNPIQLGSFEYKIVPMPVEEEDEERDVDTWPTRSIQTFPIGSSSSLSSKEKKGETIRNEDNDDGYYTKDELEEEGGSFGNDPPMQQGSCSISSCAPPEDGDEDDDFADDKYANNNNDEGDKGDEVVSAKPMDNKYPAVEAVTIRIIDNWGNPDFTCLYRIRLHGRVMH